MSDSRHDDSRPQKFAVATSGILWAFRTQNSFWIHVPLAMTVIALGVWLRIDPWRWAALAISISMVICAELLNTSIEQLVRALHPEHDPSIGRSLDVAAGAVLVAALGAVAVGLIALGPPLWNRVATFL